MTEAFDSTFKFYADQKGWDWKRLKAQAIAESNLEHDAVSNAGAMGLTQFMAPTWRWIWRDVLNHDGLLPNPFDPVRSIEAQATYMGILLLQFGGNWPKAWAAYNWGPGRVKKNVLLYGGDWDRHLPAETSGYVARIGRILDGL